MKTFGDVEKKGWKGCEGGGDAARAGEKKSNFAGY